MKKILAVALGSVVLLTACSVDPQKAAERRESLKQSLFPNPADRQGIYLAFPIETGGFNSTVELIYFPDEVSEATLKSRMTKYCTQYKGEYVTGQAYLKKRGGENTITSSSGVKKLAKQVYFSCFEPKSNA